MFFEYLLDNLLSQGIELGKIHTGPIIGFQIVVNHFGFIDELSGLPE